jgi:DNA-binding CsgD family transcriptional regulator
MTQNQALEILKTGVNVFLTGEPGAGKTYTINQYVAWLRSHGIEPAITASTGIAATHIGGMTIHSWSGIGILEQFNKYDLDRIASTERIVKRVQRTKVLIIDEVSMLSAQTLSMVEAVCREVKRNSLPFGGLQVIFIGDFFQLPPIVRNIAATVRLFAYHSPAWLAVKPLVCYLTEQYRQDDDNFSQILSAIRGNSFNNDHLTYLETRIRARNAVDDSIPRLFTHNVEVDRVNEQMLARLKAEAEVYEMTSRGPKALVETLKKGCLSPEKLSLKVGAVVMFTKNNMKEGFVNGTLGKVEKFDKYSDLPIVKTRNGELIEVDSTEWALEENGKVRAKIMQLPLRLAWAITVHKSQGMSMDAAAMDLSEVFEFGQGYVALSRVRRLSGIYLFGWNERTFNVHPEVLDQDESFRADSNKIENDLSQVQASEIQKIQNNFILACGGNLKAELIERGRGWKVKTDTTEETLRLWNENKTVIEIAQARGLTTGTILGHIGKLSAQAKINQSDLNRLLTIELKSALPQIHAAFQELTADHLSPVFEKFKGIYSYDDLRTARMMFKK